MKNEKYVLVAFPYPSSSSLHVGHYYNYAIIDSYCRWLNFTGEKTFQPMGYDSFGLPSEIYAKKMGRDVAEITAENIGKFRAQMDRMNTNYKEMFATSDPSYYKWTQWLFTKLYEKGLAYKGFKDSNWCESCGTVLANEQVINNKCDRCGGHITNKPIEQWFFKITEYKDRLIKNLEWLDYPEKTKKQQLNWLNNLHDWSVSRQRKWGCPIPIIGETDTLDTFVDSSFYFIRYCDPFNENELCSKEKYRQVDLYIIGSEHSCQHLIYSRFINMFLYDIGIVSEPEPYITLIHQGMILKDGEKMSKSKGNIVNPDDYDPGHLRMYLMFIAHYFDGGEWSDNHFNGIVKFDKRMNTWLSTAIDNGESIDLTRFIEKINGYMASFKFNKVISEWMIFYNKNKNIRLSIESRDKIKDFYGIINPKN